MNRPPRKKPPKSKKPPLDGAELWEEWSKSVSERKPGKPRVGQHGGVPDAGTDGHAHEHRAPGHTVRASSKTDPPSNLAKSDKSGASKTGGSPAKQTDTPPAAATPGLAAFDHKYRRKISTGRIKIAARVDLHGMRQHEARGVLLKFLHSAQRRGHRWVLVITGKGGRDRSHLDHDHAEPEDPAHIGYGADARGVLRRALPGWLEEPQFRAIVVSHTSAAPHHGGEGARYIQLRALHKHRP